MDSNSSAYWSATLGLLTKILIVWFLVSFGAGILFAPYSTRSTSVDIPWASGLPSKGRSTASSR